MRGRRYANAIGKTDTSTISLNLNRSDIVSISFDSESGKTDEWWDGLTRDQQLEYLKDKKRSKYSDRVKPAEEIKEESTPTPEPTLEETPVEDTVELPTEETPIEDTVELPTEETPIEETPTEDTYTVESTNAELDNANLDENQINSINDGIESNRAEVVNDLDMDSIASTIETVEVGDSESDTPKSNGRNILIGLARVLLGGLSLAAMATPLALTAPGVADVLIEHLKSKAVENKSTEDSNDKDSTDITSIFTQADSFFTYSKDWFLNRLRKKENQTVQSSDNVDWV